MVLPFICRFEFLTYIIFSFSKEILLIFLTRQVYQEQNSSIFVCLRKSISPSFLKDKSAGYRIPGWVLFFSEHFIYFTPFSSCLYSFWEVRYNFYLCSFIDKVFFFPLAPLRICLSLIFSSLYMIYTGLGFFQCLSCLGLSELPGSVVWYLTLNWGKSQVIIFCKYLFSSFLSSPFVITYMLYLL